MKSNFHKRSKSTDRTIPFCISFYRLSRLSGRYNRDLTLYEHDKCKNDSLVFDGDNCVSNALDFLFKFKGEESKNINNKIVECNLQLHAHNGSAFDRWIILNNPPCDKHILDIIENGKSAFSLKVINGYIEKKTNSSISDF